MVLTTIYIRTCLGYFPKVPVLNCGFLLYCTQTGTEETAFTHCQNCPIKNFVILFVYFSLKQKFIIAISSPPLNIFLKGIAVTLYHSLHCVRIKSIQEMGCEISK